MKELMSKEKLMKLSKTELYDHFRVMHAIVAKQGYIIGNKTALIRHMRLRMTKIVRSVNYLLDHPHSMDSSYKKRK